MKLSDVRKSVRQEARQKVLRMARMGLNAIERIDTRTAGIELEWGEDQNVEVEYSEYGDIRINVPLDWPLINSLRKQLEQQDFKDSGPDDRGGTRQWAYKRYFGTGTGVYSVWVFLNASQYKSGATCQMVQIGERQTTEPVYEVVCNEGASEHALTQS